MRNHRSRWILVAALALAPAQQVLSQSTQMLSAVAAAGTRPATDVLPGVKVTRDLKYGEAAGVANLLDVYVPENAVGKRPLIIWIHGGGGEMGDKKNPPMRSMFTDRGYVFASLNYRFSREAIYPAQLQDCKGAIRWLRAHAADYHIDADRVGVWGASAGGHFASLVGTTGNIKNEEGTVGGNIGQSSRVQAVCDFFGPTNMIRYAEDAAGDPVMSKRIDQAAAKNQMLRLLLDQPDGKVQAARILLADSPLSRMFGGPIEANAELVTRANPIRYIGKDTPPFLIVHGDKDNVVPLAQSKALADALQAAKIECELQVLPGGGHGSGMDTMSVKKSVLAFFDKHLTASASSTQPAGK